MNKQNQRRFLAEAGMIAAMYAALTMVIAPLSYGPIQFRLSEAMTVLPVFTPAAIPGLTVGCLMANLLGLFSGANPAGVWDLLLGPIATLLAAWAAYGLRRFTLKGLPFWSLWPAVITNAFIVGGELAMVYLDGSAAAFWLCAGEVAVGEAVTAVIGGGLLWYGLQKSGAANRLFR